MELATGVAEAVGVGPGVAVAELLTVGLPVAVRVGDGEEFCEARMIRIATMPTAITPKRATIHVHASVPRPATRRAMSPGRRPGRRGLWRTLDQRIGGGGLGRNHARGMGRLGEELRGRPRGGPGRSRRSPLAPRFRSPVTGGHAGPPSLPSSTSRPSSFATGAGRAETCFVRAVGKVYRAGRTAHASPR